MRIIFELRSAFASGLVKTIKKDKSWVLVSWSKLEMYQLFVLLLCHIKADCIGRNCREKAFKTIN